ncbi:metallophosphoesterase [Vannielia litorea]|uniref:metallophosphoesterase n=1 Tax=Vannielia litorea TaxID=1217970 RepID=UPI001BD0D5E7|nr:metallophosphoesterase [Vannielia litorea]MBS8225751.1 metallophosphoesterase [Vannielia litorea]
MYDIIPDIHGQAEKFTSRLTSLGYRERRGAWRHDDPRRQVVFLGDFIDRGPRNGDVIDVVRRMVDAGTAHAVMGNHELNAIHFHTPHPQTGLPLRSHSSKNMEQHASFLGEYPVGSAATADVIAWMKSLPLFLEMDGFRFVHACWDEEVISQLREATVDGRLSDAQLIEAGKKGEPLHGFVETTTKGPETELPEGYSFRDKGNHERTEVRLKWWNGDAKTWRDIAISVPDLTQLPAEALPSRVSRSVYSKDADPVFFGHYWLTGEPEQQSQNALCLDYSAGKDGPLVAYCIAAPGEAIDLKNLVIG